ncbi:MAG: TPM domain-containing protein [Chloroflexi bacterium]|nr:TPM domain-containing protein [Chloroflexota bacterium]
MGRVCIAIALLSTLLGLGVASAQELPRPSGFVNDFAVLIPEDTEAVLEALLQQFEEETTVEIAVVTVASLEGDTIEGYAVRLFQQWGIGKKGVDNGVLLLIAAQERDVRIEVGYGMEPYITDGMAGRILDEAVLPGLRQGDFALGILKGVQAIAQAILDSDYQPGTVRPRPAFLPFAEALRSNLWLLIGLGVASVYVFNFFARSKAIWPGGVFGAGVGALLGWLVGGIGGLLLFTVAGGTLGLVLDILLSTAYRQQVAKGRPTSWGRSWGGFSGAGYRSGGGSFGGFGGGRSGGGGASRGF